MKRLFTLSSVLVLALAGPAVADYSGWKHSGSVYVLTTPDGADLPAPASVEGFPLLVRLHRDFFDFALAKTNGDDLRFASSKGESLAYQIEEWDAGKGLASIWVRVPRIGKNPAELYDLGTDVAEFTNLADKKPADVAALQKRLDA